MIDGLEPYLFLGKLLYSPGVQGQPADLVLVTNKSMPAH